jgi:hypothetical protein
MTHAAAEHGKRCCIQAGAGCSSFEHSRGGGGGSSIMSAPGGGGGRDFHISLLFCKRHALSSIVQGSSRSKCPSPLISKRCAVLFPPNASAALTPASVLQVHPQLATQSRCHQRGEAADVRPRIVFAARARACLALTLADRRYKLFKQVQSDARDTRSAAHIIEQSHFVARAHHNACSRSF